MLGVSDAGQAEVTDLEERRGVKRVRRAGERLKARASRESGRSMAACGWKTFELTNKPALAKGNQRTMTYVLTFNRSCQKRLCVEF